MAIQTKKPTTVRNAVLICEKGKTMKIRDYANSVGFVVVGKLTYMGKWDLSTRCYADENKNLFFVNDIGMIWIKPHRKKSAELTADLV